MPQLHSHRMHADDFHSTPRSVTIPRTVSFRYPNVYSGYHAVNCLAEISVDAPLSTLLPGGTCPRDDRGAVVPVDRPRPPGGSAPLQRPAPVAHGDHAETAERAPPYPLSGRG